MLGRPQHPWRRRLALGAVVASGALGAGAAPAPAIVGGTAAPPGRWPWMAAILNAHRSDAGNAQFCGGFVVAPRRVVTAAHCVLGATSRDVGVLIGRTRLSEQDGRRIPVKAIGIEPGVVDGSAPGLDAAVLTLSRDAGVPVLALARPDQSADWAPGTPAWTMGWGRLTARSSPGGYKYYADRMHQLEEPLQGDDACENVYGLGWTDYPYRPAWLLCAGGPDDRAGTCFGDSGDPLVVEQPGGWLAVGIDVAGDSCASPGYYDLDTRVDAISAWALGAQVRAKPEPASAPSVVGPLEPGRSVRCAAGRWRHAPKTYTFTWRRAGSDRVVGRGRRHRVSRRDAATGLTCSVTAGNAGGRSTASAPARR